MFSSSTTPTATPSPSIAKPSQPIPRVALSRPRTYQSTLSLHAIIGTTTTNPNGFAFHQNLHIFAICAGSTVILSSLDDNLSVSQRFFRARPSVTGGSHVPVYNASSVPPSNTSSSSTTGSRARAHSQSTSNKIPTGRGLPHAMGGPSMGGGGIGTERELSTAQQMRDRAKAVTCVAISPNGQYLAAGETGYMPRILIFPIPSKDSPSVSRDNTPPLSIVTEHEFCVKSLAFSPDSQYLASLGDINDGFLYVWALSPKTGAARLYSTNKCTASVRTMCFVGNNVVTIGLRHVKVWRLGSSSPPPTPKHRNSDGPLATMPKASTGRNCVLGVLSDCTFTCIAPISAQEAIVCTDSGAICLYDDSNGNQQSISFVMDVQFSVFSVTYDPLSESVCIGGRDQTIKRFTVKDLKRRLAQRLPVPASVTEDERPSPTFANPAITCMGLTTNAIVTINSNRVMRISLVDSAVSMSDDDEEYDEHDTASGSKCSTSTETCMPGHRDSVLGIAELPSPNPYNANFFTWSSGGAVIFWDIKGQRQAMDHVVLDDPINGEEDANELKVVKTSSDANTFISGDKYGVLRLLRGKPWDCPTSLRAHGSEITDIAIHESPDAFLISSCGRDRSVQLFKKTDSEELQLLQTMDDHVGAVAQVRFMNGNDKLLSSSSDRTVIIRSRATKEVQGEMKIAYFLFKVITLKSSPVSMSVMPDDPDALVVSTADRFVHLYNVPSTRCIQSFRASDPETSDHVVMSSLRVVPENGGQHPRLLIGVCATDKSIRVYDLERNTFLSGELGHTAGVSDIMYLEEKDEDNPSLPPKKMLISSGLDGIIIVWNLEVTKQRSVQLSEHDEHDEDDASASKLIKDAKMVRQPLRHVISKSQMASFQRSSMTNSPPPISPTSHDPNQTSRDSSPARTVRTKASRSNIGVGLSHKSSFNSSSSAPPTAPPATAGNNGNTSGHGSPRLPRVPSIPQIYRVRSPSPVMSTPPPATARSQSTHSNGHHLRANRSRTSLNSLAAPNSASSSASSSTTISGPTSPPGPISPSVAGTHHSAYAPTASSVQKGHPRRQSLHGTSKGQHNTLSTSATPTPTPSRPSSSAGRMHNYQHKHHSPLPSSEHKTSTTSPAYATGTRSRLPPTSDKLAELLRLYRSHIETHASLLSSASASPSSSTSSSLSTSSSAFHSRASSSEHSGSGSGSPSPAAPSPKTAASLKDLEKQLSLTLQVVRDVSKQHHGNSGSSKSSRLGRRLSTITGKMNRRPSHSETSK